MITLRITLLVLAVTVLAQASAQEPAKVACYNPYTETTQIYMGNCPAGTILVDIVK